MFEDIFNVRRGRIAQIHSTNTFLTNTMLSWPSNADIRQVIVHHTGQGPNQTVNDIHAGHGHLGGIAYHFFVQRDGRIFRGRTLNRRGAHAGNATIQNRDFNPSSIGIAVQGNYCPDNTAHSILTPTNELIDSLSRLIADCLIAFPADPNQTTGIARRNLSVARSETGRLLPLNATGVFGHWDTLTQFHQCPGLNLNHSRIILRAFLIADTYDAINELNQMIRPITGTAFDWAQRAHELDHDSSTGPTINVGTFILNARGFGRARRFRTTRRPSRFTDPNLAIMHLGRPGVGLLPLSVVPTWQANAHRVSLLRNLVMDIADWVD